MAVLAAAAGGCGSDGKLSPSAAEGLHANVSAVRAAARAGDRARALRALGRLDRRVERAELAEADVAALRLGISRARRRVERDARFEREARAAASLNHPNIVKVFDFGIDGDRPYIVMAHIAGGSLKERLAGRDGAPLQVPTITSTMTAQEAADAYARTRLERE